MTEIVRLGALATALLLSVAACGPKFGALWATFGNPSIDVEAEYTLTQEPLLILVDVIGSAADRVPPDANDMLVDALTRQFAEHKVNEQVIPMRRIVELRRVEPKFESLAADRVGKRLGAEQVLFLKLDVTPAQQAADGETELIAGPSCTTDVRVLYAKATDRKDVRLWPSGRTGSPGKMVETSINVHDARAASTPEARARLLTEAVADQVAKLFYHHQIRMHDE